MFVNKVRLLSGVQKLHGRLVGRPAEQSPLRSVIAVKWYPRSEVNYLKLLNNFLLPVLTGVMTRVINLSEQTFKAEALQEIGSLLFKKKTKNKKKPT